MDPLDLRPRNVGEVLDAAFKLYTSNFLTLLKIAAVVLVPIGLVQVAISTTAGNVDLFSALLVQEPGRFPPGFGRLMAVTAATSVLGGIAGLLVQGASIKALAEGYQGGEVGWRDSLAFGARKAWRVFVTALLAGLGAWAGLVFCLVPGVWLWTSWYVAVPSLVVEDRGPLSALGRSFALVKRRFFPVLGIGVLAWLLTAVVTQVVGVLVNLAFVAPALFDAAGGGEPTSGGLVAGASVASTVVSLFTVPFLAAVAVAVYFDLRVRFEGLDLELLARDLGEPPPAGPTRPAPPPGRPSSPDDPFGLGP